MAVAFNEIRFPTDVALGARGGPERRTDIVTLRSGHEQRNSLWADARRRYQAGYGIKSFTQLERVLAFFEAQRGRLIGFRWRDRLDCRSCGAAASAPGPTDAVLGRGDGAMLRYQLVKTYGVETATPYVRRIVKPVDGTVRVAVGGAEWPQGAAWTLDPTTGGVLFAPGRAPGAGAVVTAGYEFDVPVRFDTDYLDIDLSHFQAGDIPNIPIIEIRL